MVRQRNTRGFTLLELVIALAIAALLAALALPAISRPPSRIQVSTTAHDIASALRLTRSRAIAQNQALLFIADVAEGVYRPAAVGGSGRAPPGVRLSVFTTQDQAVSRTSATIRFYPDGSSSGGGVSITRDGVRYDVLVDWLDGRVSIQEGHDAARR